MAPRQTKKSNTDTSSQTKTAIDPRAFLPMEKCNFDICEAASILKISRSSVYELIEAGKLKTVPYGRRAIVPGVELARVVAAFASGEILKEPKHRKRAA